MCTSVSARSPHGCFFSRNLDLEYEFGDGIIFVPREWELRLRCGKIIREHAAFLGVGIMRDGYPLLADGMNEWGLSIAGLRYVDVGATDRCTDHDFLAQFEIIPYLLATCKSVADVRRELLKFEIRDIKFDADTENQPMHFHASGHDGDIVLEPDGTELKIYENTVGVLTNAPDFPSQLRSMERCLKYGDASGIESGAQAMPGDYSSPSRFVRAALLLKNFKEHGESADDLYDLMRCVAPPKGAVIKENGLLHYTRYTAIMDTENLCYRVRRKSKEYSLSLTETLSCGRFPYTSRFK